ncbi:MAG: transposase, partial [Desulfofundulus sp.]
MVSRSASFSSKGRIRLAISPLKHQRTRPPYQPHGRNSTRTRFHPVMRVFLEVLKLCQKAGLVKLGHVALDSTKVKANASKHKAMSYERMKKKEAELEKEIEELIAAAEKTDQREDELYGKDKRGDELPKELAIRESRLKKIWEAKAALEEEARREKEAKYSSKQNDKDDNQGGAAAAEVKEPFEPKPTVQRNFTDPGSKIMPAPGSGWIQGYNAQAAVDSANQIIVAAQVSSNPSDITQLKSMVNAMEENTGKKPERLSADAGYFSE